jgi:hypothetical protein
MALLKMETILFNNINQFCQFIYTSDGSFDVFVYWICDQLSYVQSEYRMLIVIFFNWAGIDNNGKEVASGLYIFVLSNGKQNHSRKMLLIK